MAFDIKSAKPVTKSSFDIKSATTVNVPLNEEPRIVPLAEDIGKSGEILSGNIVNTAGAGIPGYIASKVGYNIPQPETILQKAAQLGGVGLGFMGGLPLKAGRVGVGLATKAIPALAAKKVIPGAARLGLESALSVAASDVPRDIKEPGKSAKESLIAGGVGLGLPIVGAGIKTLAKGTERIVGGITKGTQDWIKQRGADVVFTPEKAQSDYIGKVVVPKVQDRIAKAVEQGTPGADNMLVKLGIPKEDAVIIREISPEKRKFVSDIIKGKAENVQAAIVEQKREAGRLYGKIIKDLPPDTKIDVKDTFFKLKRNLQDMGTIDFQGNFKQAIDVPQLGMVPGAIVPTPQNKLTKIYSELLDYVKYGQGKMDIKDYQRILNDELESSLSNNPRWDRIVYDTQGSLRKTATKAVPSLSKVNKIYADASKLEQIHKSIGKLSEEAKQPMSVVLENQIYALRDPRKFQSRGMWENIMGKELYNNTLDHIANIDYGIVSELPGAAGGIYPSKSGIVRGATTVLSKKVRQLPPISGSPLIPTMTKLGLQSRD